MPKRGIIIFYLQRRHRLSDPFIKCLRLQGVPPSSGRKFHDTHRLLNHSLRIHEDIPQTHLERTIYFRQVAYTRYDESWFVRQVDLVCFTALAAGTETRLSLNGCTPAHYAAVVLRPGAIDR
jgi:hypothetical protein